MTIDIIATVIFGFVTLIAFIFLVRVGFVGSLQNFEAMYFKKTRKQAGKGLVKELKIVLAWLVFLVAWLMVISSK